jgi:hypothetical protein
MNNMDESSTSGSPPRARKRMSRRALVLSVSIVAALASATVFGLLAFTAEEEQVQVLVTAAPLVAGQTVSGGDLAEATVDVDAVDQLGAMSAEDADAVVGQTVAIPLAAGALVTAEVIGKVRTPSPGQVEATLLAADGRWPESLQAGQSVSVMATAADGTIWQASAIAHRVTASPCPKPVARSSRCLWPKPKRWVWPASSRPRCSSSSRPLR